MTTTYDPFHPSYLDEADLREEMARVYDICHGCRLCFKYCTAFPTLFRYVDQHEDQDVSKLTLAEQDQVVDECFQCKLCYINCPYTPDQHEWALDFPRLMLRADQVLRRSRRRTLRQKLSDQALGRTDLVGKLNSRAAPLVNRVLGATGSGPRRLMEKVVGIAAERVLPPYSRQRFSTWFRRRTGATASPEQGRVALFSTCLVEYQSPEIGRDLVAVYERNGVDCSLPEGQVCCGAPWLHQGDIDRFVAQGKKNVEVLARAVREGREIVVPQPTCGYVLKYDYRDYIGGADAALVADHTHDAAEYLWTEVHKKDGAALDVEFEGDVPEKVTYHAPCHLRAQNIGLKSRDLLKLTGAEVTVVAECSAIDGTWGYRAANYEASRKVARKMADAIGRAGNEVVAGDCHLANGAIRQETGQQAVHPMQILARAYGIGAASEGEEGER